MDPHVIHDLAQLQALYGPVAEVSIRKEVDHLPEVYQAMIAASPFVALATSGPDGLDVTPRGDPAGFVHIADPHTLQLPERRGNKRVDSLRNLVHDPRLALLFLIPGVNETLRVNGTARILTTPAVLQRFAMPKPSDPSTSPQASAALPVCVIEVHVQTAYFQCGRAMLRSALWATSAEHTLARPAGVPTPGQILQALTASQDRPIDGPTYDHNLPQRQRDTLY